MEQWQHCRPQCLEAWDTFGRWQEVIKTDLGMKVASSSEKSLPFLLQTTYDTNTEKFNPRLGASRSSIPLETGATTENLHFLLFIYHHSCYWCRLHIQKSSHSYMSVPPLKKGWRTLKKKMKQKKSLDTVFHIRDTIGVGLENLE